MRIQSLSMPAGYPGGFAQKSSMRWGIAISGRSFFALLCTLALAAILISPAVPSPPTVVGKAIYASVISLVVAVLPAACAVATIVLGVLYPVFEYVIRAGEPASEPVFLPLRR